MALTVKKPPTNTVGGGADQSAVVGHAPEHRNWVPGREFYRPEVDASARLEAFVSVDAGIREPTRVGARTWLMKHVHVGHDAQIGADCELAPGVCIGGHCVVGDGVRIGMNAALRPGVRVGEGAYVGMLAAVICDVPAGEVWAGNPAHRIQSTVTSGPIDAAALVAASGEPRS